MIERRNDQCVGLGGTQRGNHLAVWLLTVGLTVAVFVQDWAIELGVAGAVPYVAAVLATLWLPSRRATAVSTLVCLALTVFGFFISPSGGEWWKVILNRLYAGLAIGVTGAVILVWKEAQLRQRLLERRASRIISSSNDGMLLLDTAGHVRMQNPAANKMTGAWQKTDASTPGFEWLDADSRARVEERLAQPSDEPLMLASGDGTAEFEATLVRVEGADDDWAYLMTLRDVSARRAAERSRKLMEQRIAESTALESLGRLAGGIAHDFNNLLTIVVGIADVLLNDDDLSESTKEDLEQISAACDRAAELTAQLLAVARRQVLHPRVLEPRRTVEDMVPLLLRLLPESVQLEVHIADDVGNVMVDQSKLEQVLVNLATNASDAMPDGGTLTLDLANRSLDEDYAQTHPGVAPGDYVMIAVTDSGGGISEAPLSRVFEPFFSTKAGRGNGLGLATVHGIVGQSGGHVHVYSEPGKGTCFRVYFPVSTDPAAPQEVGSAACELPSGLRVLLVEDEEAVRASVGRLLAGLGCRVTAAESGAVALSRFGDRATEFELLLTDVVMPKVNGPALAEQLKTRNPALRVLYMSGNMENAIVRHGVLDANVHFLSKPFNQADLNNALARALTPVQSHSQTGGPLQRSPARSRAWS